MFQSSIIMPPEVGPAATAAVMDLLRLLADPAATQAKLDKFASARDEMLAAAKELGALSAKDDAITKRADEIEAAGAAERKRLDDAAAALATARLSHQADVAAYEADVAALAADRAELEASKRAHAARLTGA
jgi:hypothetical protein